MKIIAFILFPITIVIIALMLIFMLGTSHNRTELEKIFRHNIRS